MRKELSELVRHDGNSCPECKVGLIEDTDKGESVCIKCGYVSPERLVDLHGVSASHPDKASELNKGNSPASGPFGKSAMIGLKNEDYSGKKISPQVKQMIDRLRVWDSRAALHTTKDRNLKEAVPLLHNWCTALGLPDSAQSGALNIYTKAMEQKLIKGRSIKAMVAGAILVSCRLNQIPRTTEQLCEVSKLPRKMILRAYALIRTELDLTSNAQTPVSYLPFLSSKIGLPESVSREAAKLLELADAKNIWDGREPITLTCAAIYIKAVQAGLNVTQKELHDASAKSEPAIRAAVQLMSQKLGLAYRVPAKLKTTG
ncbi:MAG TPA: TFIIB-type zinc ribbon-containing protein [Candidatus Aquilonibacter sp.]|nr:TFIIB-type zinc ribbon-containing protein [Candidatus Aquilonibacter sp.]